MSETFDALARGEVALVMTDTVYGLAALPGSKGYDEIFALKKRPRAQKLPWLVGGMQALETYASEVSEYAFRLARTFWPGALTLVVRASQVAERMGGVADDGTLALRSPDASELLELMDRLGSPLACTSANEHGMPDALSPCQLPAHLQKLPGAQALEPLGDASLASSIVDCTGAYPRILREGAIPSQVILDVAIYGATLDGRATTRSSDSRIQEG